MSVALLLVGCVGATNPYEDASAEARAAFLRLPIPLPSGTVTTIRQGAFGTSSHDEPGNEYSWDFEVPFGTPVLAAADGTVIEVWAPAGGAGCDARFADAAHNVKVRHGDGTVAQYVHVDGRVEVGRSVGRGEEIGATSENGWICYPHLHFGVYASERELYSSPDRRTLPVFFEGIEEGIARAGGRYVL